jgi:hypothetical protein
MPPANARQYGKFSASKCVGAFSSLAVFAVLAANLQRATPPSWRESWATDGPANEKTAKGSLFFRCFQLFYFGLMPRRGGGATAGKWFHPAA